MKKAGIQDIQKRAAKILKRARIALSSREARHIEVTDFGIGDVRNIGAQIAFRIEADGFSARELVILPSQIFPEHGHIPETHGSQGGQEILRCRWGVIFLYTEGKSSRRIRAHIPFQFRDHFSVWKQQILKAGDQKTIAPGSLHWFQAGPKGAVISEYSVLTPRYRSIWTDPQIDTSEKRIHIPV